MRENHFYIGVRTRNNVYGNEFTNALCCSSTGIGSRFDSADVATYHNRYEAAANEDFTNEVTFAAFTIASAASIEPTRPFVSIKPKASVVLMLFSS